MIKCKKQNDTLVCELDTNINEENAAKIANTISVEMELFENEISLFFDSILVNEKEISKLQELKQLVISRISGI